MGEVTKSTYWNSHPLHYSDDGNPGTGKDRLISVLCVYDNPVFLNRICRNLENKGDCFVEISISADDALHLMVYIHFDVIVTDCTSWQSEENGFLKIVRSKGNHIPFIYFNRSRDAGIEEDACKYGRISFVVWENKTPTQACDELHYVMHRTLQET
jgi:DNA-binding NtrC family response regulator